MRVTILALIAVLMTAFAAGAQTQQRRAYGDAEFLLGPEDVIEIVVYQDEKMNATVPVRPDGKITLPFAGELTASGKTASDLQKEITQKVQQFIADPVVTVVVKEVNSPKVSVLGEVKTPGVYKIKERATLLDAIAMAGGLTEYAKKSKITLIRVDAAGEQKHFRINLDDQIKARKGQKAEPLYVFPYDKIYVE
jgi:polysaccharide export outer membrane protein